MTTTKEQFDYFVDICKKYVDLFGLYEWDIVYFHQELRDGSIAKVLTKMPEMQATFYLNVNRDDNDGKFTREDIKITAVHEVTHLLTAKLRAGGATRFIGEDELYQDNEEIANRVVALLRKKKCI